MNHKKIERLADEAWAVFCKRWEQVEAEAGKATPIEIGHHAFRAGIECEQKENGMPKEPA